METKQKFGSTPNEQSRFTYACRSFRDFIIDKLSAWVNCRRRLLDLAPLEKLSSRLPVPALSALI